jgi:hypothetical protein
MQQLWLRICIIGKRGEVNMMVKLENIEENIKKEIKRFVKNSNLIDVNIEFSNNVLKVYIQPIPPFNYILTTFSIEEYIFNSEIDHWKLYQLINLLITEAQNIASKTKKLCEKLN